MGNDNRGWGFVLWGFVLCALCFGLWTLVLVFVLVLVDKVQSTKTKDQSPKSKDLRPKPVFLQPAIQRAAAEAEGFGGTVRISLKPRECLLD